jgi:hypothetical protein
LSINKLAYVDTSALAKWRLPERGSETFANWMQQHDETCISTLTKTEFHCLLARRQRMQLLTSVQVQEIYATFQQDCQDGQPPPSCSKKTLYLHENNQAPPWRKYGLIHTLKHMLSPGPAGR